MWKPFGSTVVNFVGYYTTFQVKLKNISQFDSSVCL